MLQLQRFVDTHPPGPLVRPLTESEVARSCGVLPESLLQVWRQVGVGMYGDGLLQLIDPGEYQAILRGWLMLDDDDGSRVPIALSAFGHLFYFRKLGDDDEDVCVVDPHASSGGVLTWSLDSFFNELLCEPSSIADVLEAEAVAQAAARVGPLSAGEMYGYSPALRLGGSPSADHVARYGAVVHLDFLLQLATAG